MHVSCVVAIIGPILTLGARYYYDHGPIFAQQYIDVVMGSTACFPYHGALCYTLGI